MYNATTYAIYVDGKGRYHSYDKKLIQKLNVCQPLTTFNPVLSDPMIHSGDMEIAIDMWSLIAELK